MHKKGVAILSVLFILILIIVLYFDVEIAIAFSHLRTEILSDFFAGITFISTGIILFFIATSLFLWKTNKRKLIPPLWITFIVSVIINFILKTSIRRLRPYQIGIVDTYSLLEKTSHAIWDFSFPSFQPMLAFCALPILNKTFPKLKYYWFIFAILIALSRVYFGVHYLSDVLIGSVLGYIIGLLVLKMHEETNLFKRFYKKN